MHTILSVLGRLAFVAIFAGSAMEHAKNIPGTAKQMADHGMPQPDLLVYPTIACLAAGSVLVAIGLLARLGAALLLSFLIVATIFFHNPNDKPGDVQTMIDMMKNVALAGMCLFIMGNGAGRGSIDALLRPADA